MRPAEPAPKKKVSAKKIGRKPAFKVKSQLMKSRIKTLS